MADRSRPDVNGGGPVAQADSLVRRGLDHYGRGELLAAIGEWEQALTLQPENRRARQYYDYVVEHFDVLAERFREAREASQAELDVPFGVDSLDQDDDGDYAEVEVSAPADEAPPAPAAPAPAAPAGSVDEGWDLADEAASLPPVPPARAAAPAARTGAPAASTAAPAAGTEAPAAGPADSYGFDDMGTRDTVELAGRLVRDARRPVASQPGVRGDEETSPGQKLALRTDDEITTPGGEEPGPYGGSLSLSPDALRAIQPSFAADGLPPEETTAERGDRAFPLPNLDDLDIEIRRDDRRLDSDSGVDMPVRFRADSEGGPGGAARFDEELTTERRGRGLEEELTAERPAGRDAEEELTRERPSLSGGAPAVIVDQSPREEDLGGGEVAGRAGDADELEGTGAVAFASMCTVLLRELDGDAPAGESEIDRVRRRVSALIQRAQRERLSRRLGVAVAALDLALEEEPESATAQKLIHRSRDEFCATYEEFIGDLRQVPTLALPMHELPSQDLDSRAVFLLSRIDGTFTFEEIVDISGMSRLEALRHLAKLVLLGVLEVR